jgi:hypothetical protein
MRKVRVLALLVMSACAGSGDELTDSEADGDPSELEAAADQLAGAADSPFSSEDAMTADLDDDGLPDAVEEMLLRRYRPYYKWTAGEKFGPSSAISEVMSAQLKTYDMDGNGTSDALSCGRSSDHHLDPPETLFSCRKDTSFLERAELSNYCLNIADARYKGATIEEARSRANGLYGHVSPTTLNGHDAYQIEYWQFFPYNGQDVSILGADHFGDHEGDWTSVQLWYDRVDRRLAKIRYLLHGNDATFTIPRTTTPCRNCEVEVHGKNYNTKLPNLLQEPGPYSENAAQFYIDDKGYRHVVVYIERGGHEFWPFPWGYAANKTGPFEFKLNEHDGDGPNYLVPDTSDHVLNLGEVDHPIGLAGRVILWFNGLWGCTNTQELVLFGPKRRSPDGPALHCSWNWIDGTTVDACSI